MTEAPAEVLVCSHGARDRCCGGPGTRLTIEVRAALGDLRIRRTSHLGGHRFAPTALTLPDGRMWAFLDADALVGIVDRTLPAPRRASSTAATWPSTRGRRWSRAALLEDSGWAAVDFDDLTATSEIDGDRTRRRADVVGRGSSTDERSAEVEVATRYPVLQCGLAPSEAKKDLGRVPARLMRLATPDV